MHVPASVLPNVLECNVIAYLTVPSLALGLRLSRPAARVTFPPPSHQSTSRVVPGRPEGHPVYLEDVKRMPFTEPKVERATNIGTRKSTGW